MATNQMRRDAAKRKLAGQQARRAQQAARRRQIAVISSAAVVAVVLIAVVLLSTLGRGDGDATGAAAPASATPGGAAPANGAPGTCAYPAESGAAKPNDPPTADGVSSAGTVAVAMTTSAGPIGLTLDRAQAPCTVNSFVSLAGQGYFDATTCHRLTTGESLKVLQCGDPTGSGGGGPGYTVPDEKPTTLAPSPAGGGTVTYPRGTVAMAKTAAPNSGGSQFFLVYADSILPPDYTVFGTIDEAGLATIDQVAAAGSANGDGAPNTPVTLQTVTAS